MSAGAPPGALLSCRRAAAAAPRAPPRVAAAPLAARRCVSALHAALRGARVGRCLARARAPAPRPAATALPSWPPPEVWTDFAAAHAGAWDSYAACYGGDGALRELPARYIPSAYVEWGRTLHEWPGRVTTDAPDARDGRRLRHTLQRFWPTVGCEFGKDDVAETEAATLFQASGVCVAVSADGAYSDAPATLPAAGGALRVEQCLPGEEAGTRTRLVYALQGAPPAAGAPPGATATWRLASLELFRERRADAPDATAAVDGFARSSSAAPDALAAASAALQDGYWEASSGATLSIMPGDPPKVIPVPWWGLDPKPQWAIAPRAAAVGPDAAQLLHLPERLWAYVEQATPDMLVIESGQVLQDGSRRVVACSYARGVMDSFVAGTDAALTLDVAKAKGYIESEDKAEQQYYTELLQALEMDQDDPRGGLTPDATPYNEQ